MVWEQGIPSEFWAAAEAVHCEPLAQSASHGSSKGCLRKGGKARGQQGSPQRPASDSTSSPLWHSALKSISSCRQERGRRGHNRQDR